MKYKLIIFFISISAFAFGQNWNPINNIQEYTNISAMYIDSASNEIYLGGLFKNFNGVLANSIIKWDGTQWSAVGSGFNNGITSIIKHKGDLYAAGYFDSSGVKHFNMPVAKWDGSDWVTVGNDPPVHHPTGGSLKPGIYDLLSYNNKLYALGPMMYTAPFPGTNRFDNFAVYNDTIWSGATWWQTSVQAAFTWANMELYNGSIYLNNILIVDTCNNSSSPSQSHGFGFYRYNPVCRNMELVGTNWNTNVYGLRSFNGYLYIGMYAVDQTYGNHVARFDGVNITPLGVGLNNTVQDFAWYQGQLVAVGRFSSDGNNSQPLPRIATWDGFNWNPISAACGVNGFISEVFEYNNHLIISGSFDSCGTTPTGFSAIYPSQLTGISEPNLKHSAFQFIPNPTSGFSKITNDKNEYIEKIVVFDSMGRLIIDKEINSTTNEIIFDLFSYQNGMYFISILLKNKTVNKKLIKY